MKIYAIAILLLFAGYGLAAERDIDKTDLFTPGENGYASYRIPGIVVTPKGTLIAYCEARTSSARDWGEIDIVMRRSTDGGKTWSPQAKVGIAPADVKPNVAALAQRIEGAERVAVHNPVAILDRNGTVHFIYCVNYARSFHMRSDDDGLTFSPSSEITPAFHELNQAFPWKVFATGPGHSVELRSGRLLVPVWISEGKGASAHRPSRTATIYSDDAGKTWHAGRIVGGPALANSSEAAIVELSDGRVMMNVRHEGEPHFRAVATSPAGIGEWSPIRFDDQLPEPVCMASLAHSGRTVIFSNPHNSTDRERKNLTVKLSEDDGATWPNAKAIEPGPSAYSDLAATDDGTIYCFYERGRAGKPAGGPAKLTVAKFSLEWLRNR